LGDLQADIIIRTDDEKIFDFQGKIYQKAKQEKAFRFYILYDKVYSMHFLRRSYKLVKANKGRCGVDNVDFYQIEHYGVEKYLAEISLELLNKSYKPQPVLRVYIPKANGKLRPLGIPTIKDRIVQMSCKMVIEPIFEADFAESSHGFRPKRSASDAIRQIKNHLQTGNTEVYDADLSAYFDTIPHDKLLVLIKQRISDPNILNLIKMWLKTPVIDEDNKISGGKKNKIGTPQGGVISPLLANIYLNLVDKMVNAKNGKYSIFREKQIKIVRYADDFVLMGKRISQEVLEKLKEILTRMELTVNEEKSHLLNAREEAFNFLGFTFRYDRSLFYGKGYYWNVFPSLKAQKKQRENIDETLKKYSKANPKALTDKLNQQIRGWLNYFKIKKVSYPAKSASDLRNYLVQKLNNYYYRKSQRKSKLYRRGAYKILNQKFGLIDPVAFVATTANA